MTPTNAPTSTSAPTAASAAGKTFAPAASWNAESDPLLEISDLEVAFRSSTGLVPAVRKANLTLYPGQSVAIVGESGSGKSTLVSLVVRALDPTSGTVSLDGHSLNELDLRFLRSHVSVLHQEAVLLTGTIRENIRLGRPDASDEEVERAARVRRPAMRSASVGSATMSREGRSPKSSRISSIVAPVARLSSASPCQVTRAVEARSRSWDSRCAIASDSRPSGSSSGRLAGSATS